MPEKGKAHSVVQGERDYRAIEGDTGPIVYPAGHLYAYSILYWLSNYGSIGVAQVIFGVFYLVNQVLHKLLNQNVSVLTKALPPSCQTDGIE